MHFKECVIKSQQKRQMKEIKPRMLHVNRESGVNVAAPTIGASLRTWSHPAGGQLSEPDDLMVCGRRCLSSDLLYLWTELLHNSSSSSLATVHRLILSSRSRCTSAAAAAAWMRRIDTTPLTVCAAVLVSVSRQHSDRNCGLVWIKVIF